MNKALVALGALALSSSVAHADILSLRVEAHGGGGGGVGVGGAAKDEDFFKQTAGGSYGGLIGVEALFIDVWVEHHQLRTKKLLGTWTQFMTGIDLDYEMRGKAPDDFSKKGKTKKGPKPQGKKTGYLELGIGFGFGVGTGQQVDPPLDNAQISDKGFLIEGKFGAGFMMGKIMSLGISIPVSGGYFFKNGFANDEGNHYYGIEGSFLLVVRGKIKIK